MSVDMGVRLLSLVKPWSPKTAFGRHFVVTVWASHLSFLPCRAEHQMLCILCECFTLHTIDSFSDANGSFATSTFLGFCAEEATL